MSCSNVYCKNYRKECSKTKKRHVIFSPPPPKKKTCNNFVPNAKGKGGKPNSCSFSENSKISKNPRNLRNCEDLQFFACRVQFVLSGLLGDLIFIHLQRWEALPFLTFQHQRCIKFRVLRAQDFYTPLALNCQKRQHLPALEVYKNQSPICPLKGTYLSNVLSTMASPH